MVQANGNEVKLTAVIVGIGDERQVLGDEGEHYKLPLTLETLQPNT